MDLSEHIFKTLCLSTGHIPVTTDAFLDSEAQRSDWSLRVHGMDVGWRIDVDFGHDTHIPALTALRGHPELAKLLDLARENGCLYLALEGDADVVEGLPVFEW